MIIKEILIFYFVLGLCGFETILCFTSSKPARSSKFSSVKMSDDKISFGKKLDLNIKMPTRDLGLASSFLSNTSRVMESSWDKNLYSKLTDTSYLLKCKPIAIPGMDALYPEIEISLCNKNGIVSLNSEKWTMRSGSNNAQKESRFLDSFEIAMSGQIAIQHDKNNVNDRSPIIASGWVIYKVQGLKPNFFRMAPPFILDNTIKVIQERVQEYATAEFEHRFKSAFRDYMYKTAMTMTSK